MLWDAYIEIKLDMTFSFAKREGSVLFCFQTMCRATLIQANHWVRYWHLSPPCARIKWTADDIDMIYYFSNIILSSMSRLPGPPSFTSLDSLCTCSLSTCTLPHCRNHNLNRRRFKYIEWTLQNDLLWGILILMFVVV